MLLLFNQKQYGSMSYGKEGRIFRMGVKAFQSAASHLAHSCSGEAEHSSTADSVIRASSFLHTAFFPSHNQST